MERKIEHQSIWLLSVLTRIAFWALFAVSLLFISRCILKLTIPKFNDAYLNVAIPINFKVMDKGTLEFRGNNLNAELNNAVGSIGFNEIPKSLTALISFLYLPFFIIGLLSLWYFKKFLLNVKGGNIFKTENARILKKIAYFILSLWIFRNMISAVLNFYISHKFIFKGIEFNDTISITFDYLWVALTIWVLSHIFEKGNEIEEENSLTI